MKTCPNCKKQHNNKFPDCSYKCCAERKGLPFNENNFNDFNPESLNFFGAFSYEESGRKD